MFRIATFGINGTPPPTIAMIEGGRNIVNSLPRQGLMVHPDE